MATTLSNITKGIINLMLAVVTVLLGLRFVLRLFGANPNNDFVDWVYQSSGEVLGPFRGIFPAPNLDGFVIEFSTIFALLVYMLIAMLAFYLVNLLTPSSETKK